MHRDLSGIYLVIDPSVEHGVLVEKVHQALEGGVGILQIWNNWPREMSSTGKEQLIATIIDLAEDYEVPVLINEEWPLLKTTGLDGVHFDVVPDDFDQIKEQVGRDFIAGITCGNDLEVVKWADQNDFDYVSFCAMFPSPSVGSCEIVSPETVQKARELTDLPLFLSGGITPEKIRELDDLDFSGVAVISGILNADTPRQQVFHYNQALKGR
ncbi:MAG: thiamine phosphate synthase [Balneolaceae bacterium]|nr:thiamine phosphate synthase [Balneolaceae bacterium]